MREFSYDDVSIGDEFHTKLLISQELVEQYCRSINSDYKAKQKVPSSILAIYKPWYNAFGGRVAQGAIHLKQKMEYYSELFVGDELEILVTVTEKYNKKDRDYLVHQTNFIRNGELCCTTSTTQIWALAQMNR